MSQAVAPKTMRSREIKATSEARRTASKVRRQGALRGVQVRRRNTDTARQHAIALEAGGGILTCAAILKPSEVGAEHRGLRGERHPAIHAGRSAVVGRDGDNARKDGRGVEQPRGIRSVRDKTDAQRLQSRLAIRVQSKGGMSLAR